MKARISDHALVKFMERGTTVDIIRLRDDIAASIDKAYRAAMALALSDCMILAHGLVYVVRDGVVTTVMYDDGVHARAHHHPRREGIVGGAPTRFRFKVRQEGSA